MLWEEGDIRDQELHNHSLGKLGRFYRHVERVASLSFGVLHREVLGDEVQDVDVPLVIAKQNGVLMFIGKLRTWHVSHALGRVLDRLEDEDTLHKIKQTC